MSEYTLSPNKFLSKLKSTWNMSEETLSTNNSLEENLN